MEDIDKAFKILMWPFVLFERVKKLQIRFALFPLVGAATLGTIIILGFPFLLYLLYKLSLEIIYEEN